MIHIEAIPYKSLDEQYEINRILFKEKTKNKNKMKKVLDLGGCFYIEYKN